MITGLKYKRNGSIGKEGAYTCRQYARFMLYSPADYYYGVLWNKLYRTDIVRRHHLYCLPDINMYEDFFFNLEYLRYAKTVSVAKEAVYYYVRRKNSLSSLCSMNLAKVLETRLFIFRHFKKVYAELGLYNDNRFEISLYPITFARDSGYAISPEVAEAEGIGSFPLSASRRAIRRLSM